MSKKYEHINFVPPQSVANAAKKGLEYRKKAGGKGGLDVSEAKSEGIGSGVQRAVNLKNRDKMSPDTVKRMKAFFDRHEKNKKIESGKKPHEDRGYVAWLLWGGDPGYSWAKKVVKQMESADKREKSANRVVMAYLKRVSKEKEAIDFSEINSLIQPGKSLNNRELARAIRLSISAEHDAVHLYELIADTTTNIFVRRIMQDVANEEKVHVGEFEKLLSVIDVEDTQFIEEGKEEVEEMMTEQPEAPVIIQEPIHTALR